MRILSGLLCALLAAGSLRADLPGVILPDPFAREGEILRICCFDRSFEDIMQTYYDGYEAQGDYLGFADGISVKTGKIGDVTVKWMLVEGGMDAYENYLDGLLMNRDLLPEDEQADLFMIDASNASKYCSSEAGVAMAVSDLGLEADMEDQYRFTKQLVSDSEGREKAVTWKVPCGALVYRYDLAEKYLGVHSPSEAADLLDSWDGIAECAGILKQNGVAMFAGPDETWYPYISGSGAWVDENGTITINENIANWVALTKDFCENGYNEDYRRKSEEWVNALHGYDDVFAFFLTSEEVRTWLTGDSNELEEHAGYGICRGPGCFMDGGSWICAAEGTDNRELAADIMRRLTCDQDIMRQMTLETGEMTNNKAAMRELAGDSSYGRSVFGGSNDIAVFAGTAERCDAEDLSYYDHALEDIFLENYRAYFSGKISEDEALQNFYSDVLERFPYLAQM